jgi:small-conductance mechanosensitive channel
MNYISCVDNFLMLYLGSIIRIALLAVVGIPLLFIISKWLSKFCTKKFSQYSGILLNRIVLYSGLGFIIVTILYELGFNITALLGAAGVLGFAVGFASQTSVSNIISGFFLVIEHPFIIGDTIKSGDMMGTVESVDLLAIRIRTSDNKLVRLPNETALKNPLTTITFYEHKRIDALLSVPYGSNCDEIKELVLSVVAQDHIFLKKPHATIALHKTGQLDYSPEIRIFFLIRAWVNKKDAPIGFNILAEMIKIEFDNKNMVITIAQIN